MPLNGLHSPPLPSSTSAVHRCTSVAQLPVRSHSSESLPRVSEFWAKAENGKGGVGVGGGLDSSGVEDEAERAASGGRTMPERFWYLSEEAPDPPVLLPFFVDTYLTCSIGFLVSAWRAVLLELANWKKAVWATVGFVVYLLKPGLAHFIGNPITAVIRGIETTFYSVRTFYAKIICAVPVLDLIVVIVLASVVLTVGESVVPDSMNSQPYVLTIAGLDGYAIARGCISVPFFLTVLVGIYGFSHFIKKRDNLTYALPVAAVLAGVGAPWLRLLAIASYLALAVCYHSKDYAQGKEAQEDNEGKEAGKVMRKRRLPLPLLSGSMQLPHWWGTGILTWMIV